MGEPEDIFASYYPTPWYKSFWKVLVLVVVMIVGIAALLFGVLVYQEYNRIQVGETPLFAENSNQITVGLTNANVTNTNVANTNTANAGQSSANLSSSDTNMNINPVAFNFTPDADDDPYIGTPGAPVQIIAFEDFQCPYCLAAVPIIKQVVENNFENVQFVYRDFPLYTIHAQARPAAEAAECADDQDQFWAFHDLIFENQSQLATAGFFTDLAEQVGLDMAVFEQCVGEQRHAQEVQRDLDEGLLAGVSATPTFIINGTKYQGVLSEAQFQEVIDSELAGN